MIVVTGCAGFIGSTLVDRLLALGHHVVGIDNFSTGQKEFLADALENKNFSLIEGDLLNDDIIPWFKESKQVYHLAANADVRFGSSYPRRDLEQNTIVTHNVLEAMRANGIKRLAFSSTGSVYGEAKVFPTPEDTPFPLQTSLYGASKLAGEGLVTAYAESFGITACIFRFVSILGERYTHGHVLDFYNQLCADPHNLKVLGDGKQKKSYLYVGDCIDAMLLAMKKIKTGVQIFNLGTNEYCEVNQSIEWMCETLNLHPHLHYSGGSRGWIGDNPFIFLDIKKIEALGWAPKFTIRESIVKTVNYLRANKWVLEVRKSA